MAAERFILRNPLAYRKRAFVSTEDPAVIEEIHKTPFVNPVESYGNNDWLWYVFSLSMAMVFQRLMHILSQGITRIFLVLMVDHRPILCLFTTRLTP